MEKKPPDERKYSFLNTVRNCGQSDWDVAVSLSSYIECLHYCANMPRTGCWSLQHHWRAAASV
jgi:hypothetical protein